MADVVIIGAGPGGLACAEHLAKYSQLDVLVIDRKQVIGPKACAGGLTSISKEFEFPEHKLLYFPVQYFELDGKKKQIRLKNPVRTISRYDLGQYQLARVVAAGAKVETACDVHAITDTHLITNTHGEIPYKFLVGADGALSLVRKHLQLPFRHLESFQYLIDGDYDKMEWIFAPKRLGCGYLWIFPHQGYFSVGAYFDPKRVKTADVEAYLKEFIQERFPGKQGKFEGYVVNTDYRGVEFGNKYLIGDAAGLVSAATGEGIGFALRSGIEVAKKIINPRYPMPDLQTVVKLKRRQDLYFTVGSNLGPVLKPAYSLLLLVMQYPSYQEFFGN
jgi:flavin-dependent dehydrogenase